MIIPDYWDEHKEKRKLSTRKPVTITRFGRSDLNQDDAKRHAKQRVEESFQKLENGLLPKIKGLGKIPFMFCRKSI
jgi:hypothetical protein